MKKSWKCSKMVYLPVEIVRNILGRLPAEPDLLRLRTVCKEWRYIIDDPVFAKLHQSFDMLLFMDVHESRVCSMPLSSLTSPSKIDTRKIQVKNMINHAYVRHRADHSCNCHGFLIVVYCNRNIWPRWALWNPFTNESLDLPPIPDYHGNGNRNHREAFVGYDVATNDYKVVAVEYNTNFVMIYSMKSGAWRDLPSSRNIEWIPKVRNTIFTGVFANGALHWLVDGVNRVEVLSLDLSSENLQKLQLPSSLWDHYKLYALGECLFVSCEEPWVDMTQGWSLYKFQDYKGEKGKWNKLMTLAWSIGCSDFPITPVTYLKIKEQIVIMVGGILRWFDVKSKECVKAVDIDGIHRINDCLVVPGSLDLLTRSHRGDDDVELEIKETSRGLGFIRMVQLDYFVSSN